jgi:hypothetical protein
MIGSYDQIISEIITRQFVRESIYIRRSDPVERTKLLASGWEEILTDQNGSVFRKDIVSESEGPSRIN